MGFQVDINRFVDYMEVVVSGPSDIKSFVDLVHDIEEDSLSWADRKVLVDLRHVAGQLDATEQVFLGELVAQQLPHLEKVASVVPAEQITRNSEAAARTHGMQLRVFVSHDEAVSWLREGAAA
ncbi:STAS/SEC14 domain-containing protein [Caenimonas koreensis]|uniref:SpoIIAA-like n=1 Tax=Caenimonas koreensis DSM 17982 TaxID=1121255 RepID=A0A844B0D6_9BURK|nr:STAS/SEC14 domain-containing protein [Caenimonas koreensis]MRD49724.1 hypothetical protein [Caenimonas koreensis DSM 17982]